MILSMVSSFSGLSLKGSTGQSVQRNWSYNTPDDNDFEARIPNGILFSNCLMSIACKFCLSCTNYYSLYAQGPLLLFKMYISIFTSQLKVEKKSML